jgi:hypothetical protein
MKAFISPAQSPTNFVASWAGSETCSGTEHPGWTFTPDCTTPLRENAAVHHSKIDCRMAATGHSRRLGVGRESACPQISNIWVQGLFVAMCHEPTSRPSKKSIERYGPPKLIVTHPHEIISGIRHTWPGWQKNSKTLRAPGAADQ